MNATTYVTVNGFYPGAVRRVAGNTGAGVIGRVAAKAGMVIAGPVVGLGFVIALPLVGLAMLIGMVARPIVKKIARLGPFLKNVALFFAAPFVGLVYAAALPFIGLAMLVRAAIGGAGRRT